MRWPLFLIVAYILLGLQTGLRALFSFGDGIWPDLILILAVFVAMFAPRMTVAWAFLFLGILTDLTTSVRAGSAGADLVLLGPSTLACVVGSWVALQLRGVVRRSVLGAATLVFLVGIFIHLVAVAVLTMRAMPWPLGEPIANWSAADELVRRFGSLLYTTCTSLLLIYLLGRLQHAFGFVVPRGPSQVGYVMR